MRPWGCVQSISTSKDHLPERRFNDTMFHLESSYPLSSIFLSAKQSWARHGFKQQRVLNLIRPSPLIISSDGNICSSDDIKAEPSIHPLSFVLMPHLNLILEKKKSETPFHELSDERLLRQPCRCCRLYRDRCFKYKKNIFTGNMFSHITFDFMFSE